MKSSTQLIILLSILLLFGSCERVVENTNETNIEAINVTLNQNESYSLNLKAGGDEQGASIKWQPQHFSQSEIERSLATRGRVIYHYEPENNYSGKDQVTINVCNDDDGTGYVSSCHLLIIYFDIK